MSRRAGRRPDNRRLALWDRRPLLPGLVMEVIAIFLWAVVKGDGAAWAVAIAALVLAGIGTFVKYSIPKRKLNDVGIPNRTLLIATRWPSSGFSRYPWWGRRSASSWPSMSTSA